MKDTTPYQFEPGKRCVLAEIYFPKKAVYQSAMYQALIRGLDEEDVQKRLVINAPVLFKTELSAYPHWFDPERYKRMTPRTEPLSNEDIRRRMNMYKSPYFGWSLYETDGVFLGKSRKMDDERSQIIRLVFKPLKMPLEKKAEKAGMTAVHRSLLYFAVDEYGKGGSYLLWSPHQKERFLDQYDWAGKEQAFAERYFAKVMRAVARYLDDCGLFVFGYLVRAFWKWVAELAAHSDRKSIWKGKLEDEIWVSSIFGVSINVVRPIKKKRKMV
ncbi:MAG TPA: hypothetical protein VJH94_02915 [Candidatus Paceibacterota bacterium]